MRNRPHRDRLLSAVRHRRYHVINAWECQAETEFPVESRVQSAIDLRGEMSADIEASLTLESRPTIRSFCPEIRQKTLAKNLPFRPDSLRRAELQSSFAVSFIDKKIGSWAQVVRRNCRYRKQPKKMIFLPSGKHRVAPCYSMFSFAHAEVVRTSDRNISCTFSRSRTGTGRCARPSAARAGSVSPALRPGGPGPPAAATVVRRR